MHKILKSSYTKTILCFSDLSSEVLFWFELHHDKTLYVVCYLEYFVSCKIDFSYE